MSTEVQESKDLQIIQTLSPAQIFESQDLGAMVNRIDSHLSNIVIDPSTDKGRKEIISLSVKVRDSKTFIEKARKEYIDEKKKFIEEVNGKAKTVIERLQMIQDRTRQPVTDYENRLKEREENVKKLFEILRSFKDVSPLLDSTQLKSKIDELEKVEINNSLEEHEATAHKLYEDSHTYLQSALSNRLIYESEQLELKKLREEAEARAKKDHEEKIAREAAEKAKLEAEEKAKKEAQEAELKKQAELKAAQDEKDRIEREKQEAIEKQKKAENDARLAAEKAAKDKADAEAKAIENERIRVQKENDRLEAEKKKREEDQAHRKLINNEALVALKAECVISDEQGQAVIKAIAMGKIPNVKIYY